VKKFLFIFYLLISSFCYASDYSLFYEEDGNAIMIIYYQDKVLFGEIIQYGGYKWFKETYSNPDNRTISFIQPGNLGVSGDAESWMIERYQLGHMEYIFREVDSDQILSFESSDGTQEIIGYISRNEIFSLSTLSESAWYAGTFIPIKKIENLIDLSELNQRTFCQILDFTSNIKGKNIELNETNLLNLMSSVGLKCSKNFLLSN